MPLLVVDDARQALGPVAEVVYGDPTAELALVGITGHQRQDHRRLAHRVGDRGAAGGRPALLGTVATPRPGCATRRRPSPRPRATTSGALRAPGGRRRRDPPGDGGVEPRARAASRRRRRASRSPPSPTSPRTTSTSTAPSRRTAPPRRASSPSCRPARAWSTSTMPSARELAERLGRGVLTCSASGRRDASIRVLTFCDGP